MGEADAVEVVSSLVVDVIEEMEVEAGPSQCLCRDVLLDVLVHAARMGTNQWSPWGSQPTEAVGDGPGS